MGTFVARDEIASFLALARDVERLLDLDGAGLARAVPAVSAWSPLQHAAHVTLANELVLRNLRSLAKGSGVLVVTEAAQVPVALERLAQGTLPRGTAQAPRMVVPPADVEVGTVREWAAQFSVELEAFARTTDLAHVRPAYVPHQILGPLDLAQWARFGVVHTRHHLAIVSESLERAALSR